MKLRQLQCLLEVVKCELSMSRAAAALHATQPAVSKQIRLLEQEIGVSLFAQRGNRLLELTPAGAEILRAAQSMWREVENIRRIAADFSTRRGKLLSVATTYTHARYMLVRPIKEFIAKHPEIDLRLQQGAPERISRLVLDGVVDLGIMTQPQEFQADLVSVPCFQMKHSLVTPVDHPLARRGILTLDMLAEFPIIGHDVSHQIGTEMRRRFSEAGLRPNFILQAQDSDVMKAYVEAGVGIAIIPKIAFSPLRDKKLRSKDVSHLFGATTTVVILRRGTYPSAHILEFIQLLAPLATRKALGALVKASIKP